MASGDDLLRSGDLDAVRAELIDTVKRAPGDPGARMYLWQLMALSGEWDKAQNHLRVLTQLSAQAQMLATVYNQAIAAEKTRLDAYAGKAPFSVLVSSSPWIDVLAQGLTALSKGDAEAGERLRDEAFDSAGDTPGMIGDRKFGWIADIDSRLGPCFEAIVSGRWGLIPFEAVSRIKTEGPKDLRDIVWLPVELFLRSGQSAAALLPARYPGSESGSNAVKLGRATEWQDGPGGEHPFGQRVWTTDADVEFGVLDFNELLLA
jgi:type VI secretion system protein ImpE